MGVMLGWPGTFEQKAEGKEGASHGEAAFLAQGRAGTEVLG